MNVPTFDGIRRLYCRGSKPTLDQLQDYVDSQVDLNLRDERESTHLDSRGRTVIHWAADRKHADAIHIFADCGADVNVQDDAGMTPLHLAVEQDFVSATLHDRMPDDFPTAFVLLCHNADDTITNDDGETAIAFLKNFDGMIELYEVVKRRALQSRHKA